MIRSFFTLIVFGVGLLGIPESWGNTIPKTEQAQVGIDRVPSEKMHLDPRAFQFNIVMAQMALGAFGIGGGPFDGVLSERTKEAIGAYQRIRGITPTADLDSVTFEALMKDFDDWRHNPPMLPGMKMALSEWDKGNVSAAGTWTSEGRPEWNPSQVTSLFCWRDWKLCVEATAEYSDGVRSIGVSQRSFSIAHWDEVEIVTERERDSCPVSAIRIDRATQAVTGIRLPDKMSEQCDRSSTGIILRLTDGMMLSFQAMASNLARFKAIIQAPGFAIDDPKGSKDRGPRLQPETPEKSNNLEKVIPLPTE